MPNLTVKDLEKLQVDYPDYQMELWCFLLLF